MQITTPAGPFTTGQIAKMFGVAPRTVQTWANSGQIGCYRLPNSGDRRITRKHLDEFLAKYPDLPRPFEEANCHV